MVSGEEQRTVDTSRLSPLSQTLLNEQPHHLYGLHVVSAIGDDDVGILFGGFDELIVHGFQHVAVLTDEHLQWVPTLGNVASDDTQQALVGLGIYEYLDVHEVAHALVVQCHDALHDDDFARLHMDGLVESGAGDIRVGGLLYGATLAQFVDLMCQYSSISSE